jgi:hypothetical protein
MSNATKIVLGLALLLSVQSSWLKAQIVRGRVVDAADNKPVAFVHVVDSSGRLLAIGDLEGRFSLPTGYNTLIFSSVGYKKKSVKLNQYDSPLFVAIEQTIEQLNEVVVNAGENPALRIIRNTQKKRMSNAPSSLSAYLLRRYDRLVIGADSGSRLPDTRLEAHFKAHELLIMESIVDEHYTKSGGKHTQVIWNRVSGLNDPVFVFLMDQLHSNDFYGDRISIGGQWYVSPLAPGSLNNYRYVLEDAIAVGDHDSLFTIRFEPLPESRFDGLKGKMSIQSPDWAIRSVTVSPAVSKGNLVAEIRQLFEKTDSLAWFPVLLNTRLWLTVPSVAGTAVLTGEGLSHVTRISTNPASPTKKPQKHALTVNPDAWNVDEGEWQNMRPDSLNIRLMQTYRFMDSLGRVHKLDRWLSLSSALVEGKLRLGGFDIPLNSMLRFNNSEGYRPGLAFTTNEKYSNVFRLGMYGAYATRIGKPLWEIDTRLQWSTQPDLWIEFSVYDNHAARESGLEDEQKGVLNQHAFRQLFYSSVNYFQGYQATLNIPLGRITNIRPAFSREIVGALQPSGQQLEIHTAHEEALVTTLGFMLRLAPGERFMHSKMGLRRLSPPNPLVLAELQRMNIVMTGNESFRANQLRVLIDYNIVHNYAGNTMLRLESGLTDRVIPRLLQFQLPGSNNQYFLFAPFSFGTLNPGAYETPGFISLYVSHALLPLRPAGRRFRPQPVFLHNMAVQAEPWKQFRINNIRPFLSHPLIETGLLITNLLKAGNGHFGAGFLYRWNLGQFSGAQSPLIFKLAFSFNTMTY